MATSWRRAAAVVVLCAASAATIVVEGAGRGPAPRAGITASPRAEGPSVPLHLRQPNLSLPRETLTSRRPVPVPATHTVVAGDTLWAIAMSAGLRVEVLAAANHLSETSALRPGMVLTVPSTSVRAAAPRRAASARTLAALRTAALVPSRAALGAAEHLALLWPSGGIVTSRFGWRVHPIFGGREFHTGMDIATRYGSPVVAARAGIVRFVGWKSGYGRIVVLEHDGGIETAYSHLSAALVNPGERVAQGQMIGRVGNSGWSTGPHLLFEVRRNGVPVDPAPYLN